MRTYTEAEVIARGIASAIADIHGPMPAIVQAYYPSVPGVSAAVVDVLPVCVQGIPTDDDTLSQEAFPVVPNVPVSYPRGGGMLITWPLVPGDVVLLVPLMLDATQWRLTGEPINAPVTDQRAHHIAHCVAIPGLLADVKAPQPNPSAKLTTTVNGVSLTLDGAGTGVATLEAASIKLGANAVNAAADAVKVATELSKIQTTLGSLTAGDQSFGTPYVPGSVAATKVKVE